MQVTWRGFGTIKRNSKQALTEGEKLKNHSYGDRKKKEKKEKKKKEEIGAEDEDEGHDCWSMLGC